MSGIDEYYTQNIPICPLCERRPAFWILMSDIYKDNWIWLYSIEYSDKCYDDGRRLEDGKALPSHFSLSLEKVDNIRCRHWEDSSKLVHHFYPKDAIFKEVMEHAMRCILYVGNR